jgi:hypothetical protein
MKMAPRSNAARTNEAETTPWSHSSRGACCCSTNHPPSSTTATLNRPDQKQRHGPAPAPIGREQHHGRSQETIDEAHRFEPARARGQPIWSMREEIRDPQPRQRNAKPDRLEHGSRQRAGHERRATSPPNSAGANTRADEGRRPGAESKDERGDQKVETRCQTMARQGFGAEARQGPSQQTARGWPPGSARMRTTRL